MPLSPLATSDIVCWVKVQVFVDDYVRGRLPPICAVTGEPTNHFTRLATSSDLSPLWLVLIFFGPVGWAIFLAGALLESRRKLEGMLPILPEIIQRRRRSVATSLGLFAVIVFCLLFGFFVRSPEWWLPVAPMLAVSVIVAIVLLIKSVFTAGRFPRAEFDASRRWVTITGVHPRFAEAVETLENERRVFDRR